MILHIIPVPTTCLTNYRHAYIVLWAFTLSSSIDAYVHNESALCLSTLKWRDSSLKVVNYCALRISIHRWNLVLHDTCTCMYQLKLNAFFAFQNVIKYSDKTKWKNHYITATHLHKVKHMFAAALLHWAPGTVGEISIHTWGGWGKVRL